MKHLLFTLALTLALPIGAQNPQRGTYGYLYCHMGGDGEYTAYAISRDGYNYKDVADGLPIFAPSRHARIDGGTRDAYICRDRRAKGYLMVTTDMTVRHAPEWDNYGIDLLRSTDLVDWESVTFDFRQGPSIFCDANDTESVYKDWSTINRVWAPQIFWDPDYRWADGRRGGYFIYYSMWNRAEEPYDRMYYSYADESFTQLTQPRLLFDWGYATIDADINYVKADGLYHMMIKKEGGKPGIYTATAPRLTGPWSEPVEDDYVNFEGNKKCEGCSAFQLVGDDTWRVAYIEYSSRPKHYRICRADKNMRNFSDPVDIAGVRAPQHGSFMRLKRKEYKRLEKLTAQDIEARNRTFDRPDSVYLFAYFRAKQTALHLAYSTDGLKWKALNGNRAVWTPSLPNGGTLLRDPSIVEGSDGWFHMVWTTASRTAIGYARSRNLVDWEAQQELPVMADEPTALNCWAPELFYDSPTHTYYIFWATTIPGRHSFVPATAGEQQWNHRIYCTTTQDFRSFTPTRLFFDGGFSAIDAAVCISPISGDYLMMVKNENSLPAEKNIRLVRTSRFDTDYPVYVSPSISGDDWAEGPSPLYVGNTLYVYFDRYRKGRYGTIRSIDDGNSWVDVSRQTKFPKGIRHGTALRIDRQVLLRLQGILGEK